MVIREAEGLPCLWSPGVRPSLHPCLLPPGPWPTHPACTPSCTPPSTPMCTRPPDRFAPVLSWLAPSPNSAQHATSRCRSLCGESTWGARSPASSSLRGQCLGSCRLALELWVHVSAFCWREGEGSPAGWGLGLRPQVRGPPFLPRSHPRPRADSSGRCGRTGMDPKSHPNNCLIRMTHLYWSPWNSLGWIFLMGRSMSWKCRWGERFLTGCVLSRLVIAFQRKCQKAGGILTLFPTQICQWLSALMEFLL